VAIPFVPVFFVLIRGVGAWFYGKPSEHA